MEKESSICQTDKNSMEISRVIAWKGQGHFIAKMEVKSTGTGIIIGKSVENNNFMINDIFLTSFKVLI